MPVLVKAEKVQAEENNELLAENLNRRRQQLFKQEMGSRLKSKINATAAILPSGCYYIGCTTYLHTIGPEGSTNQDYTGRSLSEGLILASTNPQYDDRLFMKIESSEHAQNM